MIEREERGKVTVLRMRHGKANAMDAALCEELVAALRAAGEDASGAVVLTGTGGIFSAGVDLLQLRDGGEAYLRLFLPALSASLRDLFFFPKPVVAAVNGHAIAGGCILVCACDYRVMARGKGRVGVPELQVGIPFPAVALEIVRFAIPAQRFQEVVYLGRTYDVDAAHACGLVDELVDADACLDRAIAMAETFAAAPAEAVRSTKRQMRQRVRDFLDRHGATIDAEVDRIWASEESAAAIDRYVEKTLKKPVQKG